MQWGDWTGVDHIQGLSLQPLRKWLPSKRWKEPVRLLFFKGFLNLTYWTHFFVHSSRSHEEGQKKWGWFQLLEPNNMPAPPNCNVELPENENQGEGRSKFLEVSFTWACQGWSLLGSSSQDIHLSLIPIGEWWNNSTILWGPKLVFHCSVRWSLVYTEPTLLLQLEFEDYFQTPA